MKYAIALLVFFTFSCKSQKPDKGTDKRLTLLVQDGYFPIENPETQIIRDSKSLKAFFSKVNQTRKPGLPIPEIDFKTHSVLVACMGVAKTDALPIMYVKNETSEEITISVQVPNEIKATAVPSYPFCMYSMVDEGKRLALEMK